MRSYLIKLCLIMLFSDTRAADYHYYHNFPRLKNDLVLRAARGEPVERVPVWIYHQSGRHLPEYVNLIKNSSFYKITQNPYLASNATLFPVNVFSVDAAIMYLDVLVVPVDILGMKVDAKSKDNDIFFENPMRNPNDVDKLPKTPKMEKFTYIQHKITMTRHDLNGRMPLIGYTIGPWTFFSYMLEEKVALKHTKSSFWLKTYPEATTKALGILIKTIVAYLIVQAKGGVQMLQIYELRTRDVSFEDLTDKVLDYFILLREEFERERVKLNIKKIPMVLYCHGCGNALRSLSFTGYDVLALDSDVDPDWARTQVGGNVTLQGNYNPNNLFKSPNEIRMETVKMVQQFGNTRYIANLGDMLPKNATMEAIEAFVTAVHGANGAFVPGG